MEELQRFQVVATYITETTKSPYPVEYPRVMGYYDASNSEQAFGLFMIEHAPDVRSAQWFHDDILIIPVPKNGYACKLSDVYGQLAKFPNRKLLDTL